MNKITLKVLLGITILISAFFLVGCDNKSRYSTSSFPKAQRQLVKAIKKADLETVKDLAYKIDLETTNKDKVTILKASILEAFAHKEDSSFPTRVEIISELVRAGANPKNYSGPGASPYGLSYTAVETGNYWVLKSLLDGGMSPNSMRGGIPLISDVIIHMNDNMEPLKILIEAGADINFNYRTSFAPIFTTFSSGTNVCAALYLVENGARIDAGDPTSDSVAWSTFRAETILNDGTALNRYLRPDRTLEESESYIEKQKDAVVKLKGILIERGHEWPPQEPEQIKKNREKRERIEEEKRLHKEKYYN